jgi:hypothetical protein
LHGAEQTIVLRRADRACSTPRVRAAPDYPIATYAWSIGDGQGATTPTRAVIHVCAQPGIYTATLTVTDQAGCATAIVYTGQTASCNGSSKAITTQTITIAAPAPLVPPASPALSALTVSPRQVSLAGRKVDGKCAKPTTKIAAKPRCKRATQLTIGCFTILA